MKIVSAGVESSLLASLLNALIYVGFGLMEHLLDTRRMNASIGDKVFHGYAADLATNRVETRDRDALGGVIDDKVGAGELFEGADVAAFATDDATLQIVRGDMDG